MNLYLLIEVLIDKFAKYIFYFGDITSYLKYKGMKIGLNCEICSYDICSSEPWLVEIRDNVTIAPGVRMVTHDASSRLFRKNLGKPSKYGNKFGKILIHENSFIGMNSIVLPNVEIGPNSVVGSGSVVTKTIPGGWVYAGNPAKKICTIEEYIEKYKKLEIVASMNRDELRKELTQRFWAEER